MLASLILVCSVADHAPPHTLYFTIDQTVCFDHTKEWQDRKGNTCRDYVSKGWCTQKGGDGVNWKKPDEYCDYHGTDGRTAWTNCCGCGGGYTPKSGITDDRGTPCNYEHDDGLDGILDCLGGCISKDGALLNEMNLNENTQCYSHFNCDIFHHGRPPWVWHPDVTEQHKEVLAANINAPWILTTLPCDRCGVEGYQNAATTCVDEPSWKDLHDRTCADYIDRGWCDWKTPVHPNYRFLNVERPLQEEIVDTYGDLIGQMLIGELDGSRHDPDINNPLSDWMGTSCHVAPKSCCDCGGGYISQKPGDSCTVDGGTGRYDCDFVCVTKQYIDEKIADENCNRDLNCAVFEYDGGKCTVNDCL